MENFILFDGANSGFAENVTRVTTQTASTQVRQPAYQTDKEPYNLQVVPVLVVRYDSDGDNICSWEW